MKILLLSQHVRASAQATPLAAACLAAALPPDISSTTCLIDVYLDQSEQQLLDAVVPHRPDIVAVSLYAWNRKPLLSLTRRLRDLSPDLILIAGGPEASADCQAVQTEGRLDAVICGEGEGPFAALINALLNSLPTDHLPGVYTGSNARPDTVCCDNLSDLRSPYLSGTLQPHAGSGLLWEVARGCPFRCAFCYDAKGQQGVRPLPEARLIAELKLFAARNVEQIWVLDSTFNAPPERGRRLLKILLKHAPNIHYHLEAKADFLDRATVELLSRLSCSVQIGLQSTDPHILKPLNRNCDPQQIIKNLDMLSQAGITFGLDLIFGLPGDNHRGFKNSLNTALKTAPNQIDTFPLAILPGTQLAQQRDKLGLKALEQPPYDILSAPGYPPEQLKQSHCLSAATDLFYNRGRAVGFLLPICQALNCEPTTLLERFWAWLLNTEHLEETVLLNVEGWHPEQIAPLQKAFLADELKTAGKLHLQPLVTDLLNYHYHYAETLLGGELPTPKQVSITHKDWHRRWKRADRLQLVDFHYDLDELLENGGLPLDVIARTLQPEASTALFLRRGSDILCESLQKPFIKLLRKSDGTRPASAILVDCDREDALEMLEFAVQEGLLQPI